MNEEHGSRKKKVLVLGGKLQGVEAVYLMKKSGWQVTVVDLDPDCAASAMADTFLCFDIMEADKLQQVMREHDFIIPALEKLPVLSVIDETARECGVKMMFCMDAYRITRSKLASDAMFHKLGVSSPRYWPNCSFPVIAKPSDRNGSEGVCRISERAKLELYQARHPGLTDVVVQEYLEGPSYSIEIIAEKGRMWTFEVTELEMDDRYDCKRVICPSGLSPKLQSDFAKCAGELAEMVKLDGIMDVEAILNDGQLKVLEIDARLPSQTLTAVYHSTGVVPPAIYAEGIGSGGVLCCPRCPERGVIYEHIYVEAGQLRFVGEHIMGTQGALNWTYGFFGADEALTNYRPGRASWAATLMITADSRKEAWKKHEEVIRTILDQEHLECPELDENLTDCDERECVL